MSAQTTSLQASNGKYWSVDLHNGNKVMPNGTATSQPECQFMVDLIGTIFSVAANMYVKPDAGGLSASSEGAYPWTIHPNTVQKLNRVIVTSIQINVDDSNGVMLSNDSLIIGTSPDQFECDPTFPV